MKKVISYILCFVIVLSSNTFIPRQVFADENMVNISTYEFNYLNYLNSSEYQMLFPDLNFQYTNFESSFRGDALSQYFYEMTHFFAHTDYVPSLEQYVQTLVAIMATYEMDNAEKISEQYRFDNLKTIKDYAFDIVGMGANAVGVMSSYGDSSSTLEEVLSVAIDGLDMLSGNIDNWVEALSNLQTIVQDYSTHDDFLRIVEVNSNGDLKKAASLLRTGLENATKIKLESYNKVSEENFDNYTEFFSMMCFLKH